VSRPLSLLENPDQVYLQTLIHFWNLVGTRNDVMLSLDQPLNAK